MKRHLLAKSYRALIVDAVYGGTRNKKVFPGCQIDSQAKSPQIHSMEERTKWRPQIGGWGVLCRFYQV